MGTKVKWQSYVERASSRWSRIWLYSLCLYCCGNERTKLKIAYIELEVPWKYIVLGLQFKKQWTDRKDTHFLLTVYQKSFSLSTFSALSHHSLFVLYVLFQIINWNSCSAKNVMLWLDLCGIVHLVLSMPGKPCQKRQTHLEKKRNFTCKEGLQRSPGFRRIGYPN